MKTKIGILTFAIFVCVLFSVAMGSPLQQVDVVADKTNVDLTTNAYLYQNRAMVPAKEVFETIGANVSWNSSDKKITISKGEHTVVMALYCNNAIVDGNLKRSEAFPALVNDVPMVPARFVGENLMVSVEWDGGKHLVELDSTKPPKRGSIVLSSRGNPEKYPLVVIDAGHGGKDPGAVYGDAVEKNLNLDIARRLKKVLDDNKIKNIMTRSGDRFVNLYDRSGLANKNNAGLFLSIHNNAGKSTTKGTMTLYHPSSVKSKQLASIVQNQLVNDLGTKDLGIIPRTNLAVLRTTRMPAVIAEVGYITNSAEKNNLLNEDYRQKAAESLAKAIVKALEEI